MGHEKIFGKIPARSTLEPMTPHPARQRIPAQHAYVYVLVAQNWDGRTSTYVGWTLDLDRRLAEHNRQDDRKGGARSTAGRLWALVYAERLPSRLAAMKREYQINHDRAFRTMLRVL
jgi:putative endonuclease